jgi:hypothetical protein
MYNVALMNAKLAEEEKRKFEGETAFIKVALPCKF